MISWTHTERRLMWNNFLETENVTMFKGSCKLLSTNVGVKIDI